MSSRTMDIHLAEDLRLTLDVTQDPQKNCSTVRVTKLWIRNRTGVYVDNCFLTGNVRINGNIAANLILNDTQGCVVTYANGWDGGGVGTWGGYSWQDVTVAHEPDGTAKFTAAASITIHTTSLTFIDAFSRSGTFSLPRLPRVSTLAAEPVALGQTLTLHLTREVAGFTDTVTWKCGSKSGTLAERTSEQTLLWRLPLALAEEQPRDSSVTVTFTIETYQGNEAVGQGTLEVVCPIPEQIAPALTLTVEDTRGHLQKYGGYIQSTSTLATSVSAGGSYGSTISKIELQCGKLTASGPSAVFSLPESGTVTVRARVTDSRGRTAETSETVTVLPWQPPKVSVTLLYRCGETGEADPEGAYAKMGFSAESTRINGSVPRYYATAKAHGAEKWERWELEQFSGQYRLEDSTVFPVSIDTGYDCAVAVADDFAETLSAAMPLGPAFALADFCRGDQAVGLGMRAAVPGALSLGLPIHMHGHGVQDVAEPQLPADAATKQYVDRRIRELEERLKASPV